MIFSVSIYFDPHQFDAVLVISENSYTNGTLNLMKTTVIPTAFIRLICNENFFHRANSVEQFYERLHQEFDGIDKKSPLAKIFILSRSFLIADAFDNRQFLQ